MITVGLEFIFMWVVSGGRFHSFIGAVDTLLRKPYSISSFHVYSQIHPFIRSSAVSFLFCEFMGCGGFEIASPQAFAVSG